MIRLVSSIAGRLGGEPMTAWLIIHLVCFAIFLELCDRAPEME
jgi:hypothetical protein